MVNQKSDFLRFSEFQAEHCRCRHERDELRRRTERASDGKTASNDAATQHSREGGERDVETTQQTQLRHALWKLRRCWEFTLFGFVLLLVEGSRD